MMEFTDIKINGELVCRTALSEFEYRLARKMVVEKLRSYPNCHHIITNSTEGLFEFTVITPDDLSLLAIDPD